MRIRKLVHAAKTTEGKRRHKFDWVDAIFLVFFIGLPVFIVYWLLKG